MIHILHKMNSAIRLALSYEKIEITHMQFDSYWWFILSFIFSLDFLTLSSVNLLGFFHWVDLSTLSLVLNFQIAKIGKAKEKNIESKFLQKYSKFWKPLKFVKIRNNILHGIYLVKEVSLLEKEVLLSSIFLIFAILCT